MSFGEGMGYSGFIPIQNPGPSSGITGSFRDGGVSGGNTYGSSNPPIGGSSSSNSNPPGEDFFNYSGYGVMNRYVPVISFVCKSNGFYFAQTDNVPDILEQSSNSRKLPPSIPFLFPISDLCYSNYVYANYWLIPCSSSRRDLRKSVLCIRDYSESDISYANMFINVYYSYIIGIACKVSYINDDGKDLMSLFYFAGLPSLETLFNMDNSVLKYIETRESRALVNVFGRNIIVLPFCDESGRTYFMERGGNKNIFFRGKYPVARREETYRSLANTNVFLSGLRYPFYGIISPEYGCVFIPVGFVVSRPYLSRSGPDCLGGDVTLSHWTNYKYLFDRELGGSSFSGYFTEFSPFRIRFRTFWSYLDISLRFAYAFPLMTTYITGEPEDGYHNFTDITSAVKTFGKYFAVGVYDGATLFVDSNYSGVPYRVFHDVGIQSISIIPEGRTYDNTLADLEFLRHKLMLNMRIDGYGKLDPNGRVSARIFDSGIVLFLSGNTNLFESIIEFPKGFYSKAKITLSDDYGISNYPLHVKYDDLNFYKSYSNTVQYYLFSLLELTRYILPNKVNNKCVIRSDMVGDSSIYNPALFKGNYFEEGFNIFKQNDSAFCYKADMSTNVDKVIPCNGKDLIDIPSTEDKSTKEYYSIVDTYYNKNHEGVLEFNYPRYEHNKLDSFHGEIDMKAIMCMFPLKGVFPYNSLPIEVKHDSVYGIYPVLSRTQMNLLHSRGVILSDFYKDMRIRVDDKEFVISFACSEYKGAIIPGNTRFYRLPNSSVGPDTINKVPLTSNPSPVFDNSNILNSLQWRQEIEIRKHFLWIVSHDSLYNRLPVLSKNIWYRNFDYGEMRYIPIYAFPFTNVCLTYGLFPVMINNVYTYEDVFAKISFGVRFVKSGGGGNSTTYDSRTHTFYCRFFSPFLPNSQSLFLPAAVL